MIVCPNCKEEIDDDSRYCDQCGQQLSFCERCGRVGNGKRCTSCGGVMIASEEYFSRKEAAGQVDPQTITLTNHLPGGTPQLMLFNDAVGIRIVGVDGAIIGRRQGPYVQSFSQHLYVSGVHAQLKYDAQRGWCVTDKHSSNGTKLNDRQLQPDVETPMTNGDTLVLANIALRVSIK